MKFFAAAGVVPEIVQEAGTKTAALALVAARIGITIVPESLARRDQRGILFKRFTGNYPSLEIHVIYKKMKILRHLVIFWKWLVRLVRWNSEWCYTGLFLNMAIT